jgi:hypothetical protein
MSAPKVTRNEDTIIGKIPNDPFVGAHLKPKMIFFRPILWKRGKPSARIKIKMRKRNSSDERAKAMRTHFTKCSFVKAFLIISTDEALLFQNILPCL